MTNRKRFDSRSQDARKFKISCVGKALKYLPVLRVFHYNANENKLEKLDEQGLHALSLTSDTKNRSPLGKAKSFVWLDVSAPTKSELDRLAQRFALDPQIMEDLRGKEGRPKIHDYDGYIYLIFHEIKLSQDEHNHIEVDTLEIDCLVGSDWILTIHPQPVPSFDELAVRWDRRPDWMKTGAGHLLYELMDSVMDAYFPVLERINERIDEFEETLYQATSGKDEGEPLSSEIFALKRGLLQMRHIADPMRDVVTVLQRRDLEAGGRQSAAFQDLHDHASRIVGTIDTYREVLSSALDVYLAIESNRMNAVMKRLTSYSIILLLPTLIAGIYGMNFDDLPKNHGFYGSIGAMAALVVVLLIFFKKRGWL